MTDGLPHRLPMCMVAFWHVISLWRAAGATAVAEIRVKSRRRKGCATAAVAASCLNSAGGRTWFWQSKEVITVIIVCNRGEVFFLLRHPSPPPLTPAARRGGKKRSVRVAQNVSLMAGKRGDGGDWKRDVVKKMFGGHIKWDTPVRLDPSTGTWQQLPCGRAAQKIEHERVYKN